MRVGAILSSDSKSVKLLGYGIYLGDEVPPPGIKFLGIDLCEMEQTSPKIQLDNGDIVWGCECWWGSEEQVKRDIGDRTIEIVSITEERKLC